MSLQSDFNAAVENTPFSQAVAIAVSRTVMSVLAAASPPPAQIALAKRFLLSPVSEIDRYLLPVAAQINMASGSFTVDADIIAAVNAVLLANVKAGIT